ncbi:alpha/beta fold hydrolase [Cellulosimicrobium protaetiae]|uniref:Alpha/beta hydrolase n=1 Tax=Cellulosimicrobium protaetiae TaxID=2587808 RepID=A0A6M5UHM2_9MICO|nr:alpha/beta hydrolase [Cellulosimicrobium protaetiae]QJW36751.1 alpha/beta hydrolase [Cellulosimicrobium protaetiae]
MLNLPSQLRVDGCTLHFEDSGGDGTPVVLLHGAGTDRSTFAAQGAALASAGYRPVLPDLRGHGASRPGGAPLSADRLLADVEALVDHLDLDRPVLVGHSLGGNLAQHLVRRSPDRYAALAVLDATWSTGPLTRGEHLALRAAAPLLRLVPSRSLPRLMADASAVTPAARAVLRAIFTVQSKPEFLGAWRATTQLVAPEPDYRTPVPLLLLRGAADRTGNIATAMPCWAATEGVQEVVVPGAGHVVMLDAPDAVDAALLTFLATAVGHRG